jgi:hypothetical protein
VHADTRARTANARQFKFFHHNLVESKIVYVRATIFCGDLRTQKSSSPGSRKHGTIANTVAFPPFVVRQHFRLHKFSEGISKKHMIVLEMVTIHNCHRLVLSKHECQAQRRDIASSHVGFLDWFLSETIDGTHFYIQRQ